MPRPRDEPDSLKAKRRQLAEQERILSERMSRLAQELRDGPDAAPSNKPVEPPVWRLEEETSARPAAEPILPRGRNLARQRQRDKILFFLFIALLLVVMCIFFWVYRTHSHGGD